MKHLYIDVTQTAAATHHTGIQRIVRSLWQHRNFFGVPVTPLVWSSEGQGFRRLGGMEKKRLENYFSGGWHRSKWISRLSKKMEALRHRFGVACMIPQDWLSEEGNLLFLPEVFSDDRCNFFVNQKKGKLSTIAVCHDVFSWSHPEWTTQDRRSGFSKYLQVLAEMDHVICPSQFTESELKRFWQEAEIGPSKTMVSPWPCDFTPPTETDAKKTEELFVLCVGTIEPRKNHQLLLEVAERLWKEGYSFELMLVGRPQSKKKSNVIQHIRSLQKAGFPLKWKSSVSDETLKKLYAKASFTVYPSLGEGFGLPIMESLSHGVPCLCSQDGAMAEIARGGGCLQVDVGLEKDLYAGWKTLLSDGELREQLAKAATQRNWPVWDNVIRSWSEFFRNDTH